ncbi:MAG TPA: AMP-binding protein [Tepidisphaeraceae bacterium]|jgi:long-chain acyl-CoA synthetase|nr:AMP-binding protein [Tepidisphaeraceae bacterium]
MLVEPLLAHAAQTPNEIALHDESGPRTYEQLAAAAAAISAYLPGFTNRPNIGLMLPAGAGFVASFYGTLLAGKSVVPVNFLLSEREIAHIIDDSSIDTLVTIGQLTGKIRDDRIRIVDLAELAKMQAAKPVPPANLLAMAKSRLPKRGPDDLAVLMYTSGTSGLPKGVVLSFGNLQSDVDACIQHARLEHKHVFLGVIPLFHSFGMTAMMLAPIQLRATIIYMARFSAVAALNAVREHGVSLMFAVPSMFAAIAHLKNAGPEDFKSIYAMISGGEPLPAKLRETFQQRFGVTLYEGYGLTETSPVVALNIPHEHRPGSVGKPIPGVEIKFTDDNGNPVPPGQTGEIWLRGPMVMKGYHNLPQETAAALTPDGYFKTGDLGMMDADGFIFITGRKKDLIIVAGEKAAPREIEEILLTHPAVAEAAVVGKKDPGRGEQVVAFIIAKEGQTATPESLRDVCRERGLAQWKIPREFYFPKDLPRSPTGKVLKRLLVEQVNQGTE